MRIAAFRPGLLLGFACLLLSVRAVRAGAGGPVTEGLPGPAEVAAELRALCAGAPGRATLVDLGRSFGGREVLGISILLDAAGSAADTTPAESRPALLVVGGLDGRRLHEARALLDLAAALLQPASSGGAPGAEAAVPADGAGGPAVDATAATGTPARPPGPPARMVIVPLVAPDAASALLGEDGPAREQAGNGRPDDRDRDGRVDEDGPHDLDGDGLVAWMRVPDPEGEWVVDEHDPRAMRKARRERGERGTHRLLREGADADGDGETNEDGPDGVDLDRNFPAGWHDDDRAAGAYPLSEPGARALADLVLHDPSIAAVLVIGAQDTLVKVPKPASDVAERGFRGGLGGPLQGLLTEDRDTLAELSRRFGRLPDAEAHKLEGDGLADGSFLAWSYLHAGRWPLALKLWEPPKDLPKPKPAGKGASAEAAAEKEAKDESGKDDGAKDGNGKAGPKPDEPISDPDSPVPAALLAWLDEHAEGRGILPWKAFEHPLLGRVEIGGLAPGATLVPPQAEVAKLVPLLRALVGEVCASFPKLVFEDLKVERRADDVFAVEAALVNSGGLPLMTRLARIGRLQRPVAVTLELPEGGERLVGPRRPLVSELAAGGGRQDFRWVVSIRPGSPRRVRLLGDCEAAAAPAPIEGELP